MIDPLSEDLGFHRLALAARQQRQEILASNIANADTPRYKARDVDFKAALRAAQGDRQPAAVRLALTSSRHIPGAASALPSAHVLYRLPVQPRMDGNTVDMDVERMHFADNTLRYQTELTVLSTRLRMMQAVLQG